jgi:hypothetical protein
MMNGMTKAVTASAITLGGAIMAVVAIDVSAPVWASVGAAAALGAGLYQAFASSNGYKKPHDLIRPRSLVGSERKKVPTNL